MSSFTYILKIAAGASVSLASIFIINIILVSNPKTEIPRNKDKDSSGETLPSYLIPAYTTHARFLPKPSKHAFSYPLIYLGLDLDDLEDGSLDLPSRVFGYGFNPFSVLLGIRRQNYLTAPPLSAISSHSEKEGIPEAGNLGDNLRSALLDLLEQHSGINKEEVGRIWVVTMPSFMGIEGINPLTVWYIYNKTGGFIAVVLEVHNTFGEKHTYILPITSQFAQSPDKGTGYTHTFIFPRSFHVSPFNDRSGYYRLDMIDPFQSSSSPSPSPSTASAPIPTVPHIKIFLRLLTPTKELKLQALLESSPSSPSIPFDAEHTFSIISAVFKWPLSLLLTMPRIMYEAYKLHFWKSLSVYPRPEPKFEGDEKEWNAPERSKVHGMESKGGEGEKETVGVPVGWQAPGLGEGMARRIAERHFRRKIDEEGIIDGLDIEFLDNREDLSFRSSYWNKGGKKEEDFAIIKSADPKFFTNLIISPSFATYRTLAPEQLTTIVNPHLLKPLFDTIDQAPLQPSESIWFSLNRSIRSKYIYFLFSHSQLAPEPNHLPFATSHWTDNLPLLDQVRILFVISMAYIMDTLEEWIFRKLGARFVEGREPWKVWERAMRREYDLVENTKWRSDRDFGKKLGESLGEEKSLESSRRGSEKSMDGEWVDIGSIRYR